MPDGRVRDLEDAKAVIERRREKATRDLARARMKGETLDVEYLRGQINELNFMDGIVLILLDKQKRAASAASA